MPLPKPQAKREVGVPYYSKEQKHITIHCGQDAITEFKDFGDVCLHTDKADRWTLYVDGRFDFDEVLAYIQSYGQESTDSQK